MIQLADQFVNTIRSVHKEKGETWLKDFDTLIDYCEKRWSMQILAPFDLSFNFVAPAIFKDGTEVVVKLALPSEEYFDELEALKLFNGNGMASLIDCDTEKGVIILERITPGNTLAELKDDDRATRIASKVVKQLWTPALDNTRIPNTVIREKKLTDYRKKYKNGMGPFSAEMLKEAEHVFRKMNHTIEESFLLHGDIHHFNILSGKGNSWSAIDPKGLIGEREYDLIQFLLNQLPADQLTEVTKRRIDILVEELNLDKERLLLWGFCHATLASCWSIEDEGDFEESFKMVNVFKDLYNREYGSMSQ